MGPSPVLRHDDDPFMKFSLQRKDAEARQGSNSSIWQSRRWGRRVRLLRHTVVTLILLCIIFIFWKWKIEAICYRDVGNKVHGSTRNVAQEAMEESNIFIENDDRVQIGIEKASFVMLVRNDELAGALRSMSQIESRFNYKFKYPWTFLNDEPFTREFIQQTTRLASGRVEHGLVPSEQWSIPPHIDKARVQDTLETMGRKKIIYGDSLSYRHMCRYQSGFFWRHELVKKYDYYWRVEPEVDFYCDIDYDVFTFMRENKKKYGFVISVQEFPETIKTLWSSTQDFISLYPQYLAPENSMRWITTMVGSLRAKVSHYDHGSIVDPPTITFGRMYNLCHFWSNFEIGDLNFWRSEAYTQYFEYLDQKGGFFYERWGDAPVHSIAAALFLKSDEIHFFHDIGYKHHPMARCPFNEKELMDSGKCQCPFPPEENFDTALQHRCTPWWWALNRLDPKTGAPRERSLSVLKNK